MDSSVGESVRNNIDQLWVNIECSLEVLPGTMKDRDGWWLKCREICAVSMTWWWLDYEMLSIFLKHPIHLKWYHIFWNTLYMVVFQLCVWKVNLQYKNKEKNVFCYPFIAFTLVNCYVSIYTHTFIYAHTKINTSVCKYTHA